MGTLSADGRYTAPWEVATEQTVQVIAGRIANPAKAGSATITLLPGATGGSIGQATAIMTEALCRRYHAGRVVEAGPDQFVRYPSYRLARAFADPRGYYGRESGHADLLTDRRLAAERHASQCLLAADSRGWCELAAENHGVAADRHVQHLDAAERRVLCGAV